MPGAMGTGGALQQGINGGGSADSTTKAAVSEGTITVRNGDKQQQSVADLSRDVANANPGLDKIFDKEKEQRRVETVQAVVDIGMQVSDIVRTEGKIAATKSATEALNRAGTKELAAAKTEWLKANPGKTPAEGDIVQQLYQTSCNKAMLDSGKGTGSAIQWGISAASALAGASGGPGRRQRGQRGDGRSGREECG